MLLLVNLLGNILPKFNKQLEESLMKNKRSFLSFAIGLVAMIVIVTATTGCNEEDKNPTAAYKIERENCTKPYKCSYDLRIEDKLSEQELTAIANKIKAKSSNVENVFIVYYLPCMQIGNGGWATSNFTPDLNVYIQEYMLEQNPTCKDYNY